MNVKEIIPKIKEAAAKVSTKSRRAILIGGAAVLVFAVVFAVLINRKDYTVLYLSLIHIWNIFRQRQRFHP